MKGRVPYVGHRVPRPLAASGDAPAPDEAKTHTGQGNRLHALMTLCKPTSQAPFASGSGSFAWEQQRVEERKDTKTSHGCPAEHQRCRDYRAGDGDLVGQVYRLGHQSEPCNKTNSE